VLGKLNLPTGEDVFERKPMQNLPILEGTVAWERRGSWGEIFFGVGSDSETNNRMCTLGDGLHIEIPGYKQVNVKPKNGEITPGVTDDMVIDIFTKSLLHNKHWKFTKATGLRLYVLIPSKSHSIVAIHCVPSSVLSCAHSPPPQRRALSQKTESFSGTSKVLQGGKCVWQKAEEMLIGCVCHVP
jgi:hypothetical protein